MGVGTSTGMVHGGFGTCADTGMNSGTCVGMSTWKDNGAGVQTNATRAMRRRTPLEVQRKRPRVHARQDMCMLVLMLIAKHTRKEVVDTSEGQRVSIAAVLGRDVCLTPVGLIEAVVCREEDPRHL